MSAKPQRIFAHGAFEPLAPGVWRLRGRLAYPLTRNMIVVRLPSGKLLLHSVVALDDAGLAALEKLGRPAYAIVPSVSHQMDTPFYKARHPELAVLCPAEIRSVVEKNVAVSGTVEDVLPALGATLHRVAGMKVAEYAYQFPLADGRLLVVNDAFAGSNLADRSTLLGKMVGLLGAPGNGFGTARIVRLTAVSDLAALKRFAGELAAIPNLRLLTVSHGDPVTADPAGALRRFAAS